MAEFPLHGKLKKPEIVMDFLCPECEELIAVPEDRMPVLFITCPKCGFSGNVDLQGFNADHAES